MGCLPAPEDRRRARRTARLCHAGVMGQLEQIWSDAAAEVHQIVVGPMDNNVYILRCRRTGEAMLIDAANEHEELLADLPASWA